MKPRASYKLGKCSPTELHLQQLGLLDDTSFSLLWSVFLALLLVFLIISLQAQYNLSNFLEFPNFQAIYFHTFWGFVLFGEVT
jgi:hypothetical protein